MPGRRRTSFRSGDLAEDLGIFLLKGLAAVAEVQRQEDVGLDAIATLLRPDSDGNSYAEDTFVVQLKSESITELELRDHEFRWFTQQTLPMFIGRVSLKRSEMALYSTIYAHQAIWSLHAEQLTMHLAPCDRPAEELENFYPWTMLGGSDPRAWLGEPVLLWTANDMSDRGWAATAYETLKNFIQKIQRELLFLSCGQCSKLKWSTNNRDSLTIEPGFMKGGPADLQLVPQRCEHSLKALMMAAVTQPNRSGEPILRGLVDVVNQLRKLGVEVDSENYVRSMHLFSTLPSQSE
jgi:hypothetical protein